jgi:asparagine synthase (glutamine-hydrolysing)
MPGIAGIITKKPGPWAESQVLRMVGAQRHESFYTCGTWKDEGLGIYIGWTALRNSFSDGMPLNNERGDVTLIFSGEEYPEPGTAQRLKQQGHSLDSENASYLVHLYEDNPNFLTGLNGMFHGLLVDRTRGKVTLFNDRYGMHKIHYHEAPDAFYFAAEAKAILTVLPELRTADPRGLGEFMACSCVLENRTIFKGIHVLPGASAWSFQDGSIGQKTTYFLPREWEEQDPLEPESFYRELRDVFSQNLPRYFNGRQPVGMTLTGGLDTRVIMAWHKPAPGSLPCYTFGGMLRECEDVRLARRVAKVCQQSHEVLTVGDEFLSKFPHYAERSVYLTEGGVDVYRASDLYVSERARNLAPVKVVGTYGSEIIRHAVMFKPMMPQAGLYRPDFLASVERARATYAELRREHPVTFAAFRQSPWYHSRILALEQSQLSVRSPYLDNDFVRTVFRGPKELGDDVRLRLIRDGDRALASFRTDRGIGGNSGQLVSAFARNAMEFTFKAEYAYDYGMPQWVARVDHLLSPLHLERLFLGRHKLLHFRMWYRDSLCDYIRETLLDPKTLGRPYLEPKGVEAIVRGHLGGGQNHTTAIHKLLTMELLHRLFLDRA